MIGTFVICIHAMPRDWLFVSDVDDTLLGDADAVAAFTDWYRDARSSLRLALNSGRFFDSVYASVVEAGLPKPDAFIGGVGTDICFPPHGNRLPGWPPAAGTWNEEVVRQVCAEFEEFELQPAEFLSPYKVSYYAVNLPEENVQLLSRRLEDAGLAATIIYSSRRDLDILPAGANKGTAVAHLAKHWGIDSRRVIVAGNSGNDLDMFRQGFRGVVVGNAHVELKALNDPNVFHANKNHAAGVLEGLKHWLASP
jgi:sucrose-6F-phosphate phosphohydrolase